MKKFKITYVEGDTINKTEIVEAPTGAEAMVIFTMKHPDVLEISGLEEVTE